MDFLSAIVEIDQDYRKCYAQENGNTLLLDLFNTPTGTIERLYLNKNKVETIGAVLNNVEGFDKNYLPPQVGHEREFMLAKLNLLEHARKKTTQKVNLFEKVQIPGYQDALRKIKRFMEDEENLSKSSQKIMKSHQEKRKERSEEQHV